MADTFKSVSCDSVYQNNGKLVGVDGNDKIITEEINITWLISIHVGSNGKVVINYDTDNT